MNSILFDTNIVIYMLRGNQHMIDVVTQFPTHKSFISVITWIETLAGSFHHEKNIHELEEELNAFIRIPIDDRIGKLAAKLFEKNIRQGKKIKNFQDGLIAATAISHNIPLLTNNPKDFKHFAGLKVIAVK